jgi:hypothetical protein
MKTTRREWPTVRQYVKSGNINFQVDLRQNRRQGPKKKNFTDRQAALNTPPTLAGKSARTGFPAPPLLEKGDPRAQTRTDRSATYGMTIEAASGLAGQRVRRPTSR